MDQSTHLELLDVVGGVAADEPDSIEVGGTRVLKGKLGCGADTTTRFDGAGDGTNLDISEEITLGRMSTYNLGHHSSSRERRHSRGDLRVFEAGKNVNTNFAALSGKC